MKAEVVKLKQAKGFGGPQLANDSDMTNEVVIIRLKEGKIIGLTIPNAKKRLHLGKLRVS